MARVSIVIPTLNEAACLERTLRQLTILTPPAWEVIIVDGGSEDDTVTIAQRFLSTYFQAERSDATAGVELAAASAPTGEILAGDRRRRASQMNAGAKVATGNLLCFLHADTIAPDDLVTVIEQTLSDPRIACGGFVSIMAGAKTTRWGITLHNYLKTYYAPLLFRPHLFVRGLRLLFGDQVMFCRRCDFWDCGGFDESLPIMEDGNLCLRLLQKGSVRQVNRVVQSSDRRIAHWGALKATAIYLYIGVLWGIGVSATYLKRFYEEVR
jgi:rSAM/selenodomain-associated transferase 2